MVRSVYLVPALPEPHPACAHALPCASFSERAVPPSCRLISEQCDAALAELGILPFRSRQRGRREKQEILQGNAALDMPRRTYSRGIQ